MTQINDDGKISKYFETKLPYVLFRLELFFSIVKFRFVLNCFSFRIEPLFIE